MSMKVLVLACLLAFGIGAGLGALFLPRPEPPYSFMYIYFSDMEVRSAQHSITELGRPGDCGCRPSKGG